MTFGLTGGTTVKSGKDVKAISDIKVGDRVTVVFSTANNVNTATSIALHGS